MVRTCLGCARKAFLPATRSPYQQELGGDLVPGAAVSEQSIAEDPSTFGNSGAEATRRGWVVQELLKAVRRCLFCGNNFTILI
jgi:hypothetical protein